MFNNCEPLGFEAGDANLYRYVFNRPTNANDPTGLERMGQTETQLKKQAADLKTLQIQAQALHWPTPPLPPPGSGIVYTFIRPVYFDFAGICEIPGLLPHEVVVVLYNDQTFTTYSFDGAWHVDDEKDRAWVSVLPVLIKTQYEKITGVDVKRTFDKVRSGDDMKGYSLFTHNCISVAGSLINRTYLMNNIPRPIKKEEVRIRR